MVPTVAMEGTVGMVGIAAADTVAEAMAAAVVAAGTDQAGKKSWLKRGRRIFFTKCVDFASCRSSL